MRFSTIIIFLLIVQSGVAQVSSEIPFIGHLINKGYYKEAIYLINQDTLKYKGQQLDSLNYYKGWAHYSLKDLEESTVSFLKVGAESSFYRKSFFFAGYNQTYLGNYDKARKILGQMNNKEEPYLSLLNFEFSGIEMLQGHWSNGENLLNNVNRENAILSQQIDALEVIGKEHENHRSKSPVLAGIISGLIPGSGKIYAGKTGAGIASMISTIGVGLITWENYHKAGIKNAKTIIFGGIFAVSYISNIYGSVVSVKVNEIEYENALHNQILFQLHIPLRNFFD